MLRLVKLENKMVQTPERVRGWPHRDHHQNDPKQKILFGNGRWKVSWVEPINHPSKVRGLISKCREFRIIQGTNRALFIAWCEGTKLQRPITQASVSLVPLHDDGADEGRSNCIHVFLCLAIILLHHSVCAGSFQEVLRRNSRTPIIYHICGLHGKVSGWWMFLV